ncbi:MAG: CvpA family protein [Pseudomonadota bacterium]|nr:CvpA family protein [Pseudomonadota bacterium]
MSEPSGFSWLVTNLPDLLVITTVVLSSVFAFYRGFVREALAIAGWVGAAFVTLHFFPAGQSYARNLVATDWLADLMAAATIFIATLAVVWLAIHVVVSRVRQSPLNSLDRSLGFLFGAIRGVLVIVVLYVVATRAAWREEDSIPPWVVNAHTFDMVDNAAGMMVRFIPENILNIPAIGLREVQDQAEELKETKEKLEEMKRFAEPRVTAPEVGEQPPAYNRQETGDMDRLIDNLQNDSLREID